MTVPDIMSHSHSALLSILLQGLSQQIDSQQTHMSNLFQGTLTHMSPEVLTKGQVSFASDVYAFGITLWELMTSSEPFQGEKTVSLGHSIAVLGSRPVWPEHIASSSPDGLQSLAVRCWATNPGDRPTMEKVLDELVEMRKRSGGGTQLVDVSKYSMQLADQIEKRNRSLASGEEPK